MAPIEVGVNVQGPLKLREQAGKRGNHGESSAGGTRGR